MGFSELKLNIDQLEGEALQDALDRSRWEIVNRYNWTVDYQNAAKDALHFAKLKARSASLCSGSHNRAIESRWNEAIDLAVNYKRYKALKVELLKVGVEELTLGHVLNSSDQGQLSEGKALVFLAASLPE